MDNRLKKLSHWLTDALSIDIESINPASEDASFRRYFRITCHSNNYSSDNSLIAMDAPPAQESLHEFIAIDQALVTNNIHAPKIHAINIEEGFLLLEDFGNRTYLDELQENSNKLYNKAIESLISLQKLSRGDDGFLPTGSKQTHSSFINNYAPPIYGPNLIEQELNLFITWYYEKHLRITLSTQQLTAWIDLKRKLIAVFEQQPKVWVHRDFHSRNLMITKENSPGVIDFQDMVWGPISYDLVSIFKDCYIEWPREKQLEWLKTFLDKRRLNSPEPLESPELLNSIETKINFEQLVEWYDLTGLQRHLKVLGIFCRLNYRDGKSHYLLDLPLVEKYIVEVLDIYPLLKPFKNLFTSLLNND